MLSIIKANNFIAVDNILRKNGGLEEQAEYLLENCFNQFNLVVIPNSGGYSIMDNGYTKERTIVSS